MKDYSQGISRIPLPMTELFAKLTRSELMSRIRGKSNKSTELRLISILRDAGIRGWRRNMELEGRPDFVFPAIRVAIFVDGCFWHGCPEHFKQPKTNPKFWSAKIANNQKRDRRVAKSLKAKGWTVARIWEHSLKRSNENKLVARLTRLTQTRHKVARAK